MTNKKTIENAKLGLFVLAGLLFLVLSLYMIGRNRSLFGSTYKITADFNNVGGLVAGNNVRFSGIDVGTVNKVAIVSDSTVRVTMLIEDEYKDYIRQNAIAAVGTDGLMGNKLINIKAQSGAAPPVEDGGHVQTRKPVETDEMLQTLNTTNDNVAVITFNLKEITEKLNKSNSLWSFLSDTAISKDLKKAVKDIRQAGASTAALTRDAASMVKSYKDGHGLARALFTDTVVARKMTVSMTEIQQASKGLHEAAQALTEAMKKVEQGRSPAGVVMTDSLSAVRLRQTILNVEEGTARFNENMEAMRHNFLFRGYFKDQEKEKNKKKK